MRELWRKDAGDLLIAHESTLSAITSMVDRVAGIQFEQQEKGVEGRMSLTAQFIQGIDICEVAISEGLYSQAAALLKQQMETIEAIDEYGRGKRKDGKTPQLNILKEFGRIYGEFNQVAHVAIDQVHKNIVQFEHENISGPSIIPQYQKHMTEYYYGYHVFFMTHCAAQMIKLFREVYKIEPTDDELLWLSVAFKVLRTGDFIEYPKED